MAASECGNCVSSDARQLCRFFHCIGNILTRFCLTTCMTFPIACTRRPTEFARHYALMADDASRREYLAQMRFRLLGDFDVTAGCRFRVTPILGRNSSVSARDEMLIDCGAFDGDTLDLFLKKNCSFVQRRRRL